MATTEKGLKLAKDAYATLCNAFDEQGWHYTKHEEDLIITLGLNGDDIPMQFIVHCDAERQLIKVLSFLPFKMSEDKRIEGAVATSYVNYKLADGVFGYNVGDGSIFFKMTSSFRESLIGKELFNYMVACATYTVDRYNDQFLMLSKGTLSLEDFVKAN